MCRPKRYRPNVGNSAERHRGQTKRDRPPDNAQVSREPRQRCRNREQPGVRQKSAPRHYIRGNPKKERSKTSREEKRGPRTWRDALRREGGRNDHEEKQAGQERRDKTVSQRRVASQGHGDRRDARKRRDHANGHSAEGIAQALHSGKKCDRAPQPIASDNGAPDDGDDAVAAPDETNARDDRRDAVDPPRGAAQGPCARGVPSQPREGKKKSEVAEVRMRVAEVRERQRKLDDARQRPA